MEENAGTRLTERFGDESDREILAEANYCLPAHVLLEKVSTELVYSRDGQLAGAHLQDDDIADALVLLDLARRDLDAVEFGLLRTARKREMTWKTIARLLDLESPQAAQQRAGRLERVMPAWVEAEFRTEPSKPS